MILLIAIMFLLKWYGTNAVPLPTPTSTTSTLHTSVFSRDDPSDDFERTIADILRSCLATTFACSWVSVYLNVPRGNRKHALLMQHICFMFFSVIAPEFMIMWAFKQWRGAVRIKEWVNKARPKSGTFHF